MLHALDTASSTYQPLPIDVDAEKTPHTRRFYRWGLRKSEFYGFLLSAIANFLLFLFITFYIASHDSFKRWKGDRPTYCESYLLEGFLPVLIVAMYSTRR